MEVIKYIVFMDLNSKSDTFFKQTSINRLGL
jgi:hypothetical protein